MGKEIAIGDGGYLGKTVEISPMGELRVANKTRQVGTIFTGETIDTNFWYPATGSFGSGSIGGGYCSLTTNTVLSGTSLLQSIRNARYISGNALMYRAIVSSSVAYDANNTRRWGIFSSSLVTTGSYIGTSVGKPQDGYYFELSGSTFNICGCSGSTVTSVSSSAFSASPYNYNNDWTTYEIYATNKSAWFVINDVLIHKMSAGSTPRTSTLHLPIRFENFNNGGGSTNIGLHCMVASISSLGEPTTRPIYKNLSANATTICKRGPGTLHRVIINNAGESSNTLTIYDNVAGSGTTIASIDTTNTNTETMAIEYGLDFYNGLTVVMATGTAANVTLVYE